MTQPSEMVGESQGSVKLQKAFHRAVYMQPYKSVFTLSSSALDLHLLFFHLQREDWKQFIYFILYFPRALLFDLASAPMQLLVKFVYKDRHLLQKTQTKYGWSFFPALSFLPNRGSGFDWQQKLQNSDLAKFQQLCDQTHNT